MRCGTVYLALEIRQGCRVLASTIPKPSLSFLAKSGQTDPADGSMPVLSLVAGLLGPEETIASLTAPSMTTVLRRGDRQPRRRDGSSEQPQTVTVTKYGSPFRLWPQHVVGRTAAAAGSLSDPGKGESSPRKPENGGTPGWLRRPLRQVPPETPPASGPICLQSGTV